MCTPRRRGKDFLTYNHYYQQNNLSINHHTPAKNMNNPPSPPTLLPGWIISGTDLATAKSANQFAAVDIDAPLARRKRGYVSGG
jgi:hypothetical protein